MIELRPGDYFCVYTDTWLAKLIMAAQRVKALDDHVAYNHAGIIVSGDGRTYEALMKIEHAHIKDYEGCEILIARHRAMTPELFDMGYGQVLKWNRTIYPWWRLLLHLTGLAVILHIAKIPVCSELAVEHLHHCGLIGHDGYGWNPDHFADMLVNYKDFEIIYEDKFRYAEVGRLP
jgi:hypothetical protein